MERVFPMALWTGRRAQHPAAEASEEVTDEALLAAHRAGDPRAFETLVRRHRREVLRVALRLARDPDEAEDLAQRAFVRALGGAERFRGETSFRGWLLRIVVNLGRNHLRDGARFDSLDAAGEREAEAPEPGEQLDQLRRRERVRAAVETLPPRQREVVLLRIDGNLPFAEVAAALGITENAAKVSFHLGVKRLKERLSGAGEVAR